jgi:hypothetical protein
MLIGIRNFSEARRCLYDMTHSLDVFLDLYKNTVSFLLLFF